MPVVPRYEGPQVNAAPLPQVRFRAADTGAEKIGQGLQAVGSVVGQFAEVERQKADAARVMEADNALWDAERTLFHDPQNGYFNTHGKDAIERGPNVFAEWEKQAGAIEASLSSPAQKLQFQRMRSQRAQSLQSRQMQHQASEGERYAGDQLEAKQLAYVEEAGTYYNDPAELARIIGGVVGVTESYAATRGVSSEVRTAAVLGATTKVHAAVVSRMLAGDGTKPGDPAQAMDYLDANTNQIGDAVEEQLRTKIVPILQERQGYSEAMVALSGGVRQSDLDEASMVKLKGLIAANKAAGMDEPTAEAKAAETLASEGAKARDYPPAANAADALKRLREWYPDPTDPVRKHAEQTINRQESEREAAEADRKQDISLRASVAVQNAAPGQTLSQVLGPDLHAAVASMGALDGFERELDSKAQGRQAKSDEGLLLNINRLIGEAQQGKQASLDMLQRMNAYDPSLKLSLTDRNWLRDLQSSIRTGNPKALAAAASDAEVTGLVNDYRRRVMGIADAEVKTGSGKRYDEAEVFNQTMRRWISEYTADPKNKGRKPTYTEVQAHADAVLISNYEKMAGETPSGSAFIPDRDFTVQSLGIPRNDLFLIVQALRIEGKPVSAVNIKAKWDSRQKPKAK